ncbi:MAG: dihydrodipicolinate synthase family protein [Chloroflexi bacterium]|nr:dihydrodipicolinate synthase family protein [Chloroflexota bacterium]
MTGPLRLDGVFGVLPTAFHDDGGLDLDGTGALVRAYVDAGVAGVTVLGVMGEAAELTEDERRRVVAAVVAGASPRPVIVGVTGETHEIVAGRARDAAGRGVSGVMVSPSRTLGLRDAVDAAADGGLPIVVQDYPAGSGVVLDHDAIATAADGCRLVVGVKAEAPPTSGLIAALRRSHPGLGLLGGLGGLFLIDELRAGATGVMTGLAMPDRLVSIVAQFATDPAGAERAWTDLLPLMRLEAFQPFSLAARKEIWRLRGVIGSARCRRAGATLDDQARDDVRRALERVLA